MPQEAPLGRVACLAEGIYAIFKAARDLLPATLERGHYLLGYPADLHEKMEIEHEHRIATRFTAEST